MAMLSLSPGPLFKEVGLNRTSTPVGPRASSADIKNMFKRECFHEDVDWPADSPVAETYDVRNTSSKLVILNNKQRYKHLRGYDNFSPIPSPDPQRHEDVKRKNEERHSTCLDSTSPHFEPKPRIKEMWVNQSTRPPWTPVDNNSTNPRRHRSCRISSSPVHLSLENNMTRKKTGVQRVDRKPPISMRDNAALRHSDMTSSNKRYMYFISKIYDMTNMKQMKQLQYRDILLRQQYLGYNSDDEYRKYMKYLEGPRKRIFGASTPLFKSGLRSDESLSDPHSPRDDGSYSESMSGRGTESPTLSSRSSYDSYEPRSRSRITSGRPKTAPSREKRGSDRSNRTQSQEKHAGYRPGSSMHSRSPREATRVHMRRLAQDKKSGNAERREHNNSQSDGHKVGQEDMKGSQKSLSSLSSSSSSASSKSSRSSNAKLKKEKHENSEAGNDQSFTDKNQGEAESEGTLAKESKSKESEPKVGQETLTDDDDKQHVVKESSAISAPLEKPSSEVKEPATTTESDHQTADESGNNGEKTSTLKRQNTLPIPVGSDETNNNIKQSKSADDEEDSYLEDEETEKKVTSDRKNDPVEATDKTATEQKEQKNIHMESDKKSDTPDHVTTPGVSDEANKSSVKSMEEAHQSSDHKGAADSNQGDSTAAGSSSANGPEAEKGDTNLVLYFRKDGVDAEDGPKTSRISRENSFSSISNGEELQHSIHREGKDRPRTRLGRPNSVPADDTRSLSSSSEGGEELPRASFYREGVDRPKSRGGHSSQLSKDEKLIEEMVEEFRRTNDID